MFSPAAHVVGVADTRERIMVPTVVTANTDRGLPYGPGAGKPLGVIMYGGYRDLIG